MKINRLLGWVSLFLLGLPALVSAELPPERILLARQDLAPEGIEYDVQGGRFLISSMAEGTVFEVAEDGSLTPFIEDQDLIASVGLEIDETQQRLLVVNADLNINLDSAVQDQGAALLGSYDLTTGERLFMADLDDLVSGYNHFANDVALDAEGNAYVTDSLAPVIYQVTPTGEASVWLEDERLLIEGFGGNGLVYHPDGYLLVGVSGVALYKIPLDDPSTLSPVETPETIAADGMLLNEQGELIVVSDGSILTLSSPDEWASAQVVSRARNAPASTIAFCGEEIYALYPQRALIVRVQLR